MTTTIRSRRRAAGIALFIAAIGLAIVMVAGGEAGAKPRTLPLAGTFDFRAASSPTCPTPCVQVVFRGVVSGPGEGPRTAAFPAQPTTNVVGEGTLTVHTPTGNLDLAGTIVFNPDPAGAGEATFMFKIVGGTGGWTGASGFIMAAGLAQVPASVATNVVYSGRLTTS